MKWYFDTSVEVALCVKGHPHHASALALMEQVAAGKHQGFISAHGMVEVYSVLTRTPFTPPLYPSEAWQLLEQSVLPHLNLVTLRAEEYRQVLKESAERGWTGGRVYDLLHLKCAAKQDCARIYTFNVRHFRELAPVGWAERVCSP